MTTTSPPFPAGGAYYVDMAATWEALAYRPNTAQKRIHASEVRHRVNAAGRRLGKSTCAGRELMLDAMQAYLNRNVLHELGIRQEEWIVGPEYTDSEKEFRVFYNDCRRKGFPFDRPGTYYHPHGDMTISLWDGAFIVHAKSAKYPESLVGEGLHKVIMAEAAKMNEMVWQRFIRPTLADYTGQTLWNTTPEGTNWFYDIFLRGQDSDSPDWQSWQHPSWINRRIFRKKTTRQGVNTLLHLLREGEYHPSAVKELEVDPEIAAMAVDLTEESFEQEVGCSFTRKAGRVFKGWDEHKHVADLPYNPAWPMYIATDYGYTHPNVALFVQEGPHGHIHVIAEYYRKQRTKEEFAGDVLRDSRLAGFVRAARGLYPDPEDPSATRTLSERWNVPAVGGTGGPLQDRIDAIELALRFTNKHLDYDNPERIPWLRFDRSCAESIREFGLYSWPKKRRKNTTRDNPEDKDNHCPEALGRWFAGHRGLGGSPTTTMARVGRRAPRRRH